MIETLQTFGSNIWQWFIDNKDAISTFFMSGQFVSLVGAMFMLVKNIKQVNNNTASTDALNSNLIKTNAMSNDIQLLQKDVELLSEENKHLRNALTDTENKLLESNQLIADKLNAILEVQSIVYTTIRDSSIRQTVNTILNNARYTDTNFKEQLQEQIEELKHEFETKVEDMNHTMDDAVKKVSNSLNAAEAAKIKAQQLSNDETTRY